MGDPRLCPSLAMACELAGADPRPILNKAPFLSQEKGNLPMTKLSDTQLAILAVAAKRGDHNVLPLPGSLRGGAAAKVVGALLKRSLIAETATDQLAKADPALNRIWRNDDDGCAILLHITSAGLAAIGLEPVGATDDNALAPKAHTPRAGTKQAKLIEMLRAEGGATIDEITAATGWQPHTVRGAMSGALKKRLGLEVSSVKVEGRGRVYRI